MPAIRIYSVILMHDGVMVAPSGTRPERDDPFLLAVLRTEHGRPICNNT